MSSVGSRSDRDVMLSRLGIIDDAPPETPPEPPRAEAPRLAVVPSVQAVVEEPEIHDEPEAYQAPEPELAPEVVQAVEPAPTQDDPLDDILSRFGIEEKPAARKARQPEPAAQPEPEPAPQPARPALRAVEAAPEPAADLDIPEIDPEPMGARAPEPVVDRAPPPSPAPEPVVEPAPPPAPEPVVERAPEPEPVVDPEVRRSQTQAEELEELRRQLRGRNRSAVPSELPGVSPAAAVAAVAAVVAQPSPPKGVRRRKNGELSNVRIGIWLVVIAVCGWLTYTVVKASVEHDQAQAKPAVVQTIEQARNAQR
ncbi:MAG TPA: hypothetical protein VF138_07915 [Caulobacteraceae bacterium]